MTQLLRIATRTGEHIDFHRDGAGTVSICNASLCARIPNCTGLTTIQLFALLEPLGEIIEEEPDGTSKEMPAA